MKGHLVIAGGNIKDNRIYDKFIELSLGDSSKIAIIPTASEDIEETLKYYTDLFGRRGVPKEKIIEIKIDPDSSYNEWKKSGDDFLKFDFLKEVKGVWFTGGDQLRITRAFLKKDGRPTKLLEKIKDILSEGGVIGGSSAGAAIMSEIMIGGGTSFGALTTDACTNLTRYRNDMKLEEKGVLLLTRGLGFFNYGVIDQHFDKRNRIGRLLESLFISGVSRGYGIGENTALIHNLETGIMSPIGSGGVSIIDISKASRDNINNYRRLVNIKLSYLVEGDSYNLIQDRFNIDKKESGGGNQYYCYKSYLSKLNIDPHNNIRNYEGRVLLVVKVKDSNELGNDKEAYIMKYQPCDKGIGYELRLYNQEGYKRDVVIRSKSFVNATMDILPILIKEEEYKMAAE